MDKLDGREESLSYTLNAVEKAALLRKMDAYCQEQTGQTLADYSVQLLAEAASWSSPTMEMTEGRTKKWTTPPLRKLCGRPEAMSVEKRA